MVVHLIAAIFKEMALRFFYPTLISTDDPIIINVGVFQDAERN